MIQKLRYTGYILPTSSDIKNKINWQKPVHNVIQRKFKENESDKNSNTKRNQKKIKLSEKVQVNSSDIFILAGYKSPLFE